MRRRQSARCVMSRSRDSPRSGTTASMRRGTGNNTKYLLPPRQEHLENRAIVRKDTFENFGITPNIAAFYARHKGAIQQPASPKRARESTQSRGPHAQSQELGIWAHRHAEEGHCRLACMHSARCHSLWALGWTASGQAGVRPPTTSRTRMAAAVPRRAAPCFCCVPGLIAARLRKVPRPSLLPPGALCPVRARHGAVARESALLLAAAVADRTVWPLLLLVVVAAAQDFVEHCTRGGRVSEAAASRPCPGVGRGARTITRCASARVLALRSRQAARAEECIVM